jgi:hypothetical protein
MTRDARDRRGRELVTILRRRSADLEATFRRHRMSQEEALTVLDEAVLEVQLRCSRVEDMEARLLRAVARGCSSVLEDRRRPPDRADRADRADRVNRASRAEPPRVDAEID